LLLFMHRIACALDLERCNAGSSIAARMAMIATTTNNSNNVKPTRAWLRFVWCAFPTGGDGRQKTCCA